MAEKTKAPFWKPALIYGAIVGFVGILLSVIFYVMDLAVASWTQWVSLLISVVILIYCLSMYKKESLGGFASFGQLWRMTLVIGIVATVIGTIFNYILMGLIDPELIGKMQLAAEQKMLNNPRIPESVMDSALERMENNMNLKRITIMGLIMGPVLYAIIGLIVAAFMKKNNPADQVA